jgi:(S)-citramalyl-CoA lyase
MSNLNARNCRSSLFWGGLRLAEFDFQLQAGADIVCIDLEDAVPPSEKTRARDALAQFLKTHKPIPNTQYIVRVNACGTQDGDLDLEMLLDVPGFISHLLLPKLESVEALGEISEALIQYQSSLNLLGIIETSQGLERVSSLVMMQSRLQGLYFGGFDLSHSLGCEMEWEALLYARSRVVHAASLGGLIVIDSPPPFVDDSSDQQKLKTYCLKSKALGMMGMVTKHINQISMIQAVFSPSQAEIERAIKILEMYADDPVNPIVYEGKLIELPMIKKLQKLI